MQSRTSNTRISDFQHRVTNFITSKLDLDVGLFSAELRNCTLHLITAHYG